MPAFRGILADEMRDALFDQIPSLDAEMHLGIGRAIRIESTHGVHATARRNQRQPKFHAKGFV
jgi:hypothetical protein